MRTVTPADFCGAKSLPWDSTVASSGPSPGKDTAGAVTPPARPGPASWGSPRPARWQDRGRLVRLMAPSVTQPEPRQ